MRTWCCRPAGSTSSPGSVVSGVATREQAWAWELRTAWGLGREVVVVLEGQQERVRGYVTHVAPTGAYATVDVEKLPQDLHVPCALVLTVRHPHFHEDGPAGPDRPAPRFRGMPEPDPNQLTLWGGEEYGRPADV